MTGRTMYDAADVAAIPGDAQLVAHYPYAFPAADLAARFPRAHFVTIDNDGGHPDCAVLDVETGAARVTHAAGWVRAHEALQTGHQATLYCDLFTLPGLLHAVDGLPVKVWIANPTGHPHVYPHPLVAATQYAWPDIGSPGDYDMSLVSDPSWHPGPRA